MAVRFIKSLANGGEQTNKGDVLNGNKGVYWIGQDGNAYIKAAGIHGVVKANPRAVKITGQRGAFRNLKHIEDPNPPKKERRTPTPTPTRRSSSSSSRPDTIDTSIQRSNIKNELSQLKPSLKAAIKAQKTKYGNVISKYDAQKEDRLSALGDRRTANQAARSRNIQSARLSGARGLRGLRGVLASRGAVGGTGQRRARKAVASETAKDISGANSTAAKNKRNLDENKATFLSADERRRQKAKDLLEQNKGKLKSNSAKTRQSLLQDLAKQFQKAGMKDKANSNLVKAGNLTPKISKFSRPNVSKIQTKAISSKVPSLQTYLAGNRGNGASVSSNNVSNNPYFFLRAQQRRRRG